MFPERLADDVRLFAERNPNARPVIAAARSGFAITHAPGRMPITDRINADFAVA